MKTTMKNLLTLALTVSLFGILVSSCRKDKEEKSDFSSESDNAEMDYENASIISFITTTGDTSAGMQKGPAGYNTLTACATISINILDTTDGWPRKVTIDFGSINNNSCGDGRYRRGQIFATFTSPWWKHMPGDSLIITTDNYYVNEVKHSGTRYVIINDSITIRVVAVNVQATWNDGTSATWNCDRTRKFIAGTSTPYVYLDDVYEHAGSANGVSRKKEAYTLATQSGKPLIQKMDCKWLVQGGLDFTPSGKTTRSIDFGSGACDNLAVVTVDGNNYNITLP